MAFMPMRVSLLAAVLCLGVVSKALAAAGGEAASFLDIPVGARPAAMGDAYTALAQDAYAITSNPAGLGRLHHTEIAAQHLAYLESVRYEHAAFAMPVGKYSGLGVSVQYLGTGDIAGRDLQGALAPDYSAYYAAYAVSYGRSLGPAAVGVTAKAIQAKISDVGGSAYAVDIGTLWEATRRLTLAAALVNAGTDMRFIDARETLPLALRMGAAYRWTAELTTSAEVAYRKHGPASVHGGAEYRPWRFLALRAGYRTDTLKELDALAGLSTGFGLDVWNHELAYAWLPYGDLGATHYLSLRLRFGVHNVSLQESRP